MDWRRTIALLVAGIALVAASARAQTEQRVVVRSVLAGRQLPANAVTSFGTGCPAGFVATSAGITRRAPGVTTLALAPVGLTDYRLRLGNPANNGRRRVTVAVACRTLAGAGSTNYRLKLAPLKPSHVTAPAGKAATATLACPGGTVPVGAGADLDPARQRAAHAFRGGLRLALRSETSTLRRLSFRVQNTGSRSRTVTLYGGCLTLARAAGAPRLRLHVVVTTFSVAVASGHQTFTRRCRSGWFSLAAGFSLPGKLAQVDGAAALASGGRWLVSSDAAAEVPAQLQLTCARLGP